MFRRCCSSSASATGKLKDKKWDALVIGGGDNGLTAATCLGRGGLSVAVLERRPVIGGAAVTEELIPGFKFSRCSYLQSLLRPSVIRELELKRHGLKLLKPIATAFTPCVDGRYLLLGFDDDHNYSEISKFSKRDADAYGRYETQFYKFCKIMDFILGSPTPETLYGDISLHDRLRNKLENSVFFGSFSAEYPVHRPKGYGSDILRQLSLEMLLWEYGKYPCSCEWICPATSCDGLNGRHVEGAMGSVSLAISKAAFEAGVHILTNAEVSQILIGNSGEVNGVLLVDGTRVHSSTVLSNATPYKTFIGLVPQEVLPGDFLRAIKYSDYYSGVTKINVAVDKLPQFHCCKPSQLEDSYAQKCLSLIDEYAPGFSTSVIGYDMLTSPDLERECGPTGGNIFHGSMGLDSLFLMCPAKGWSGYRSPVRGLHICGSGSDPGGGVIGAPGDNAAHVVLQELK